VRDRSACHHGPRRTVSGAGAVHPLPVVRPRPTYRGRVQLGRMHVLGRRDVSAQQEDCRAAAAVGPQEKKVCSACLNK